MLRLAFLILLGLPNVVFGQVDVTFVGSSSPYESSWDGQLLAFEKVEDGCFGYAEFRIEVTTPVSVTYFSSLFCEDRSPAVDPLLIHSAIFEMTGRSLAVPARGLATSP